MADNAGRDAGPGGSDYDTSASGEKRCLGDVRLRACGFAIHSRPRAGPALWARRGLIYTQSEAEELCRAGGGGKQCE